VADGEGARLKGGGGPGSPDESKNDRGNDMQEHGATEEESTLRSEGDEIPRDRCYELLLVPEKWQRRIAKI